MSYYLNLEESYYADEVVSEGVTIFDFDLSKLSIWDEGSDDVRLWYDGRFIGHVAVYNNLGKEAIEVNGKMINISAIKEAFV